MGDGANKGEPGCAAAVSAADILDQIAGLQRLAKAMPKAFECFVQDRADACVEWTWGAILDAITNRIDELGWVCLADVFEFVEGWSPAVKQARRPRRRTA